jgi:hypothetical protein
MKALSSPSRIPIPILATKQPASHQPGSRLDLANVLYIYLATYNCAQRWLNKTIRSTRAHPIDNYRRKKLLSNVLRAWQAIASYRRLKWKLTVRAQVKYNYSLLALAIKGWKTRVHLQQQKRLMNDNTLQWCKTKSWLTAWKINDSLPGSIFL